VRPLSSPLPGSGSLAEAGGDPEAIAARFYQLLRREVLDGNPELDAGEQALLRGHYGVMCQPDRYSPALASTIYARRRARAVAVVAAGGAGGRPPVLDAGCAYGSESLLFAALGARTLAVDLSAPALAIAAKRKRYYEALLCRPLDIRFEAGNLATYQPAERELELTWIASVLAAVTDQDAFLGRVAAATRPGGRIIVTDMNLRNPLFFLGEWRRRRHNQRKSATFAREADFLAMLARRGRTGARYFQTDEGGLIDDVQFFTPRTLRRLLVQAGFRVLPPAYAGCAPFPRGPAAPLERVLARAPGLRSLGYFYLLEGVR
jgi:SAM-dependent methyltransferase